MNKARGQKKTHATVPFRWMPMKKHSKMGKQQAGIKGTVSPD
jgi:hypothetical protein